MHNFLNSLEIVDLPGSTIAANTLSQITRSPSTDERLARRLLSPIGSVYQGITYKASYQWKSMIGNNTRFSSYGFRVTLNVRYTHTSLLALISERSKRRI